MSAYNETALCKTHNFRYFPMVGCPACKQEKQSYMEQQPRTFTEPVPSPTGGVKSDGEKVRYDLLSPIALEKIAAVLTHGAKKYEPHNWRKGIEFHRLIRAAMGHLLAFNKGENIDPESGLEHLAEAGCNIMFLLELVETHPQLDTRFCASNLNQIK